MDGIGGQASSVSRSAVVGLGCAPERIEQAEVALLFIASGVLGILAYGTLFRARLANVLPFLAAVPGAARASSGASGSILAKLVIFFLKARSLTFGSGLVIVPFLEKGL